MSTVISVENVSKYYRLGLIGGGTLRADFERWWARVRGKPNPLLKIGQEDQSNRQGEHIWALRDVSFEVKEGEVLGIIGRNGAGKSTLLKILSRVTAPTAGQVKVKGRVASLLEVGTGFHPELTGRENITLNGAILGMKKADIDRKFDEIVDFSGVERFIDTPVKRYSSGMYVRLAFAVAAHLEPEILLVDEVLAVGDIAFQSKCLKKMQDVAGVGRTVLFVSHNMGAINRLCPRCFLLDGGRIVSMGATSEVVQTYISQGQGGRSEYLQPHTPEKEMNLRRVAIVTQNGLTLPEIRYDQGFKIVVEYEVNRPVRDCTVWVALETLEGVMVFTTADFDTDSAMLGPREVGYYRSSVQIPPRWLNYGRYTGIVGLIQNSPVTVYDRVEAVMLTVLEIGSPSSMGQPKTRRGVLQPVLEWTTKRVSTQPELAEVRADV